MSKLKGHLEIVTNLAIIVVSVLIVAVLVQRYFFASPNPSALRAEIIKGSQISVTDIDFAKADKTLVLALSSSCHFCTESAPFYKDLLKASANSKSQIVAVLPQNNETAKSYLQNLGVSVDEIRQQQLVDIQVSGTPTLILLDKEGKVISSWVGKLPPDKEKEVLENFKM